MPISLPALPLTADIQPQILSFGSDLTPALGGPVTRMRRLGSRHTVKVSLPQLDADCGAVWVAALAQAEAEGDTLRLAWPQPALGGTAASANVSAGGQAGTLLNVTALNHPVLVGAYFSFNGADGHSYLHMATQPAAAGATQLSIAPMLRTAPPNGATLSFAAPIIEGYADGPTGWRHALKRFTTLDFQLTEDR